MEKKINEIKVIAVHDGVFHADDLLCVALINYFGGGFHQVVRTRNAEKIAQADIACDVGMGEFDHHDKERETYPNGVIMAGCGKVARWLAAQPETNLTEEELELLKIKALYAVESLDNGQNPNDLPNVYPNPFTFVSAMNALDSEGGIYSKEQDDAFMSCLMMVEKVLERIMKSIREELSNQKLLKECISSREESAIVVMPNFIKGWQNGIIGYNKECDESRIIKLVVFPGKGQSWNVQVVPKTTSFTDRSSWVNIPEKVAEIEGFEFRHAAAFMAVFGSKDAAMKAAINSLNKAFGGDPIPTLFFKRSV